MAVNFVSGGYATKFGLLGFSAVCMAAFSFKKGNEMVLGMSNAFYVGSAYCFNRSLEVAM